MCVYVCVNEHAPPEKKDSWADRLRKHHVRGWRAVSAKGLQGKGQGKKSVFVTNTGVSPNQPCRCTCTGAHGSCICSEDDIYWCQLTVPERLLLCILLPCNVATETALQRLIWVFQDDTPKGLLIRRSVFFTDTAVKLFADGVAMSPNVLPTKVL
jgi:hypothetical protein